jgi:hypothetical protein
LRAGQRTASASASSSISVTSRIALFAFCVACTLSGRAITAFEKDKYDPYFFAHVAARWMHGGIPYLEIWDNKPPGIYILGRAVFGFFDRSFPALAVVEGFFVLGAIASVYMVLLRVGAPAYAVITGTAAAALAMNLQSYNAGGFMTENFIMLPALLSLCCYLTFCDVWQLKPGKPGLHRSSVFWMLAAGFFTGTAGLFKTVGFAPWMAQMALLFLLLILGRLALLRWGMAVAASMAGMAISWLPVMLYFHSHHALRLLFSATFGHNVGYAASNWRSSPLFALWHSIGPLSDVGSLVACALIVLAYAVYGLRSTSETVPSGRWQAITGQRSWFAVSMLIWLAAELAGALAGGKGFAHYFTPALPVLSILAGLALWLMLDGLNGNALLYGCACALVLVPMTIPASQDLYRAYIAVRSRQNWLPEVKTAEFLNREKQPGDTLFVCDYKPYIYFATDMQSPSRLLFADRTRFSDYDRRYMTEIAADLRQSPPTFMVCSARPGSASELDQAIQELLAQEYTPVYDSQYTVYRRNQ